MAWTDLDSIHTPAAGTRPPASWGAAVNGNMDEIYNEVMAKIAAFTTFTPTLTQSGAVSKTVATGAYIKLGKLIIGNVTLLVTGSGTGGNAIVMGLPFDTAYNGNLCIGSGWVYDASTVTGYSGSLIRGGASTCIIWAHNQTNNVGSTPSFALASGDQISYQFCYRTS